MVINTWNTQRMDKLEWEAEPVESKGWREKVAWPAGRKGQGLEGGGAGGEGRRVHRLEGGGCTGWREEGAEPAGKRGQGVEKGGFRGWREEGSGPAGRKVQGLQGGGCVFHTRASGRQG